MQCDYCGNWILDHAKFCQTCGKELLSSIPQRKSRTLSVFQVLLALVLLAISGILIVLLIEQKRESTKVAQPAAQPAMVQAKPQPQQPTATPAPAQALENDRARDDGYIRRIKFKPGSTAETVRGIAEKGIEYVYLLRVREGQTMTFRLSSYNNKAIVAIHVPGGDAIGPRNGTWTVESVAGDYRLVISNLGEERTSYALEISIV